MCTFADAQEPICLDTFSNEVDGSTLWFKFNNSSLYADAVGDLTSGLFWDISMSSVENFLKHVMTYSVVPMSLRLTQEVLRKRQYLLDLADSAQDRISVAFTELEVAHGLVQKIALHAEAINSGQDVTIEHEYKELDWEPMEPDETRYQCCNQCKRLCCQYCAWPEGVAESPCTYFDRSQYPDHAGKCPKCDPKCTGFKQHHYRQTTKPVEKTKVKSVRCPGKVAYLESAVGATNSAEEQIGNIQTDMELLFKEMLGDMDLMREATQELNAIACKPDSFSNADLFAQMIEEEERAHSPGYETRVRGLKLARERCEVIEKMAGAQSLRDLFPEYQEELSRVVRDDLEATRVGSSKRSPTGCTIS